MGTDLLNVNDLTVKFGGIVALNQVNFSVKKDSITALIGPNGAGKTTVFNCLTGFYRATSGGIYFGEQAEKESVGKLLGEPFKLGDFVNPVAFGSRLYYKMMGGSHLVARAGIARTFQNIRLFSEMTVIENLLVAQHLRVNRNLISGILNTHSFRAAESEAVQKAYDWLELIGLRDDANKTASDLPYGYQRRLEIARAMCIEPKLICLDEPAAGLNPAETEELSVLIRMIRDKFSVTTFVIEHDMALVMDISDHVVVLNYGQVIASGNPRAIREDPVVLAAYLGTEEDSQDKK